jgi:MFS family permease
MIYDRLKVLVQWADIRRGKMDMGPVSEISAKGDESSRNPSTATANLFEENTYRKVALRLLPLLVVCYIVAYLDRVNIGFAKLQMLADLGFSDTVYAFGASIFFWGYVLFEVPSNLVLHRVGARIWIARILVSWGIASAAIMFTAQIASAIGTSNDMVFYVLRFLLGVCEAGFFPGIVLYLTYWFPADRQTKALGLFVIALPLSLVIGGPVSGGLLHVTNGIMGLNGWQWMLLLEALPAVLLGGVVFLWLDDRPDKARWLTGAERDLVVSQLSVENVHKQHYVRDALKDFRVWTMMGVVFTYNTGFYGLSFWLPTILRDAGVADTFTIGLLTAIPYACGGVVMVLNSRHASRTREYRYHGVVPAVLGGLSLIASAYFAHNIPVSMVFLTISACGIMGLMPIVWSYPGRVLSDTAAAAGIGLINSVGSLSGITGAMISGLALSMTGSVNNGTYVLGLSLLVSAGLIFLVSSRRTSVQTRSALIPATPV